MQGTMRLQEWIHRMELGAGAKYVRWFGILFGFAMLAVTYDSLCFRNFTNAEAMDMAQLGRNISRGEGFITKCVRPLSMGLTKKMRADRKALLEEGHPDLSNPPVYPMLVAGVLRMTPDPGDLLALKRFNIYKPNLYIAILNQVLFGLGALLVFRLALRWFDRPVAWMSAVLFVLTEFYWRFTVSGLSTMLVMDLILLLGLFLSHFEQQARENAAPSALLKSALAIGAVTGVAMLARYSAGWVILPVLLFVMIWAGPQRWRAGGAVFAAFAIVAGPWVVRNVMASGLPFGTATYAVVEGTPAFLADSVPRSFEPSFEGLPGQTWIIFVTVIHKGINGLREAVTSELPRLGGNWLWGFFLAGLLVRFKGANLNRLRWFVMSALVLMILVQAFGRTHLTAESPDINSENLLVLFSPFILIFGVGVFFVLFDSLAMPSAAWRAGALAVAVTVISLPLLLVFLPPRPPANSHQYYPPRIQQLSRYLDPDELWMSDVPWAVAWYGERQCVWLTLNAGADFFEVNDFHKTVNGLYISTRTGDAKFVSNWMWGPDRGWVQLLLQTFVAQQVPPGFHLRHSPEGLFTLGELLLTDRDRWSTSEGPAKQ